MNEICILAIRSAVVMVMELINVKGFTELFLRFLLNMTVIMVLIRWLYYTNTRRKDYLFTYILISGVVFLLCYLLESVSLQIGFALGLFAIFGIIRYRTNAIPIKEMTYLFLVIGISVINALTGTNTTVTELLFTNVVLIFITYGLEKLWLLKHESSKQIIYEKIELIKPEKRVDLMRDLIDRTGIKKINRIEVGRIDFQKKICELKIYYYVSDPENNVSDPENNGSESNLSTNDE